MLDRPVAAARHRRLMRSATRFPGTAPSPLGHHRSLQGARSVGEALGARRAAPNRPRAVDGPLCGCCTVGSRPPRCPSCEAHPGSGERRGRCSRPGLRNTGIGGRPGRTRSDGSPPPPDRGEPGQTAPAAPPKVPVPSHARRGRPAPCRGAARLCPRRPATGLGGSTRSRAVRRSRSAPRPGPSLRQRTRPDA